MSNYSGNEETDAVFHEVGPASLGNSQRQYIQISGRMIIIFNIAGYYYAIGDVCSHDGWSLEEGEVYGHTIVCPRHDGKFDLRSGKVLEGPPEKKIPSYPVRVEKGILFVGIPKEE